MEEGYEKMLDHLKQQFVEMNCDITAISHDITECRLVENAAA